MTMIYLNFVWKHRSIYTDFASIFSYLAIRVSVPIYKGTWGGLIFKVELIFLPNFQFYVQIF